MAKVCLALDLELEKARDLVKTLNGLPLVIKVGPPLLMEGGREFIGDLKDLGFEVFLDLKLHDIPNTVRRSVRKAQESGADYLTVHALGGMEMLREARESAEEISLIGVTLLTSHGDEFLRFVNSAHRSVSEMALSLALKVKEAGIEWVVCSAHEVRRIKERTGLRTVVPGIRLRAEKGDQKRVATPEYAVKEGADLLVVGREVLTAEDPRERLDEILRIAGS